MSETTDRTGTLLIENCCDGADILKTYREWGVQWADGVRRWNQGPLVKIECAKCHKELKFRKKEEPNE